MDAAAVKKTQDTLGKIIKKPPLTEKLLSKPPFRFLHDIVTSVIKTTGFMKGLYPDSDMNSENVKDKDAKMAFLQKAIDMVVAVTGKSVAAKPAKIVAGHEPERTNEFLQVLAKAINAGADNDEMVKKVLSGGGGEKKEEKKEKKEDKEQRHRSASRKKEDKEEKPKEKSQEREKDRDREKRHRDKDREREGGGDEEKEKDRHRDRREKSRDREDRHKDRDKDKERRSRKPVEGSAAEPGSGARQGIRGATAALNTSSNHKKSAPAHTQQQPPATTHTPAPTHTKQPPATTHPPTHPAPTHAKQQPPAPTTHTKQPPATTHPPTHPAPTHAKQQPPTTTTHTKPTTHEPPPSHIRQTAHDRTRAAQDKAKTHPPSPPKNATRAKVDTRLVKKESKESAATKESTVAKESVAAKGAAAPKELTAAKESTVAKEAATAKESTVNEPAAPKDPATPSHNNAQSANAQASPHTQPPPHKPPQTLPSPTPRGGALKHAKTESGKENEKKRKATDKTDAEIGGLASSESGVSSTAQPSSNTPAKAGTSTTGSQRSPTKQRSPNKFSQQQQASPRSRKRKDYQPPGSGISPPVVTHASSYPALLPNKMAKTSVRSHASSPAVVAKTVAKPAISPPMSTSKRADTVKSDSRGRAKVQAGAESTQREAGLSKTTTDRQTYASAVAKGLKVEDSLEDSAMDVDESESDSTLKSSAETVRSLHKDEETSQDSTLVDGSASAMSQVSTKSDHTLVGDTERDTIVHTPTLKPEKQVIQTSKTNARVKFPGLPMIEEGPQEDEGATSAPASSSKQKEERLSSKQREEGSSSRLRNVAVKSSQSRFNLPGDKGQGQGRKSSQRETEEKENDAPEQNGEKEPSQDTPSRLQRPTSAKGSRRRRQGREARDDEDEEFQQREQPAISEHDLPPQIANARKMARPPSARPAPPRPKQDGVEAEPAMRLGTGAPTNVIVDDGKNSDDEDENFLVEESAPPPPPQEAAPAPTEGEDDAEHGALVKKMLESKKEAEQQQQQQQPTRKTEIERPSMSDAQRRKQRELVAKEIERLQTSIQSLTRSANPLGKIMDYVQEDMDSMQKELDRWRSENKEHALELRREKNVTDRAIEPLKAQLTDLDRAITDQLDLIAASKSNIIRNDVRIQKMLQSIARS